MRLDAMRVAFSRAAASARERISSAVVPANARAPMAKMKMANTVSMRVNPGRFFILDETAPLPRARTRVIAARIL